MVKLCNIENSYQFKIIFESKLDAINFINSFFTQIETIKVYNYKTKTWNYKTGKVEYLSNKENEIYLHKGFLKTILNLFSIRKVVYELDAILKALIEDAGIKILDKWYQHFSNHPKKHLNYDQYQIDTAKAIEKNRSGLISLATGVGKGDIIAALVDSYLTQHSGNVVIISYTNLLLNEISLRLNKLGVIDKSRIQYINPSSYFRSKKSESLEQIEWLKNVELLIADEAHHMKTKSWQNMVETIEPKYLYGFTGSGDIKHGNKIDVDLILNHNLTQQTLHMFDYLGECLIHVELQVPIHLVKVELNIVDKEYYKEWTKDNPTKLHQAASLTLQNPEFTRELIKIINEYVPQDGIVFIPETTSINNGLTLCDQLNRAGIRTVYMSAAIQSSPIGEVSLTLKDLKGLAEKKAFRVLICNQVGVEGLDIAGINCVIPLSNKSFKMFAQPLGRAARQDELTCVLVYDINNKLLIKQMETKEQYLKSKKYIIKSVKDINVKGQYNYGINF